MALGTLPFCGGAFRALHQYALAQDDGNVQRNEVEDFSRRSMTLYTF